jgi:hypothetical protein
MSKSSRKRGPAWSRWRAAAIQARISTIRYDFWGWAEERWARASANLGGTDFEAWLGAVAEPGRS